MAFDLKLKNVWARFWVLIPLSVALLAALVVTNISRRPGGSVKVPYVTGKTWTQAQYILKKAHLTPQPDTTYAPNSVVVKQVPAGGYLARGQVVRIEAVMPSTPLPNVTGLTYEQAVQRLQDNGFAVSDTVEIYDHAIARGLISGTDPRDNAPMGARVVLNVSKGPAMGIMPKVIGTTYQDAVKKIAEAGFILANVTPKQSKKVNEVLEQTPAPGVHAKGTLAFLTVGVQQRTNNDAFAGTGVVLPGVEVPPVPIKYAYPPYPEYLKKTRIQGDVVFDLEVSPTGRVVGAKLVKSLMAGRRNFDEIAFNYLWHWEFQPGTRDGKKATATVRVKVPFYLDNAKKK